MSSSPQVRILGVVGDEGAPYHAPLFRAVRLLGDLARHDDDCAFPERKPIRRADILIQIRTAPRPRVRLMSAFVSIQRSERTE